MDSVCTNSQRQRLRIHIFSTKMADGKYKDNKLNEIVTGVCVFLNSGGGKLDLFIEYGNNSTNITVCDIVRMIEQRMCGMIEITTKISHVKIERTGKQIIIDIKGASKLITMRYNLYLPSETQVVAVKATVPTEEIKEILEKKIVDDWVPMGSHVKRFVIGENSGLQESNDVQLKNLKASASKCVKLADRMVGKSNKFTSYISAFANHRGGHIYCGIDDEGKVEGEEITDNDKKDVIKKVTKTLNKMVWTAACQEPQRGEHWDIFFEPVQDISGEQLPSTYVIVVYVAPCPGGVFTEEPVSYHIVEGKVEKMRFQDWLMKITGKIKNHQQSSSVPSHVPRVLWSSVKNANVFRTSSEKLLRYRNNEDMSTGVLKTKPSTIPQITWSSDRNRKLFRELSDKLVKYRNDHDMEQFKQLSELAKQRHPDGNVDLIIVSEEVVDAYKSYQFLKATLLLTRLKKLSLESKDRRIFEVRRLQLEGMVERCRYDYERSYALALQGLQIMDQAPIELQTVWFYIDAAIDAINISVEEKDVKKIRSNKEEALMWIERATMIIKTFDFLNTPDVQQKIRIHKVWVLLGCCMTGDIVGNFPPSYEDMKAATEELTAVKKSGLQKTISSHFRNIQFHLAQCDLLRRLAEVMQKDYSEAVMVDYQKILEKAFEYGSKARTLARHHKFDMMVDYSNKRLADLTEKLVRHALCSRKRTRRATRTFMGWDY